MSFLFGRKSKHVSEDQGVAYSFLNLASDVLKKVPNPLTYQEIWQAGQELGLASKIGTVSCKPKPWQSCRLKWVR